MRVNQIFYNPRVQSWINTISFILFVACFLLTILLPLPYHQEKAGAISLEPDPDKAAPIIALAVLIPFLMGIIFFLIFKITYRKSLQEVKNEFQENVAFQLIDNETTFKWEQELEEFKLDKIKRKKELEAKELAHYHKLKKLEEEFLLEHEERVNKVTKEENPV